MVEGRPGAEAAEDYGPASKAVCIVTTWAEPGTLEFRMMTVTTFSDRVATVELARSRMNVSTLYVLLSAPVMVCTGRHCEDEPQPLIVTSVPLPGRALSSVL